MKNVFEFFTKDRLIRIALFLVIVQLTIWIVKPMLKYLKIFPYHETDTGRRKRVRRNR